LSEAERSGNKVFSPMEFHYHGVTQKETARSVAVMSLPPIVLKRIRKANRYSKKMRHSGFRAATHKEPPHQRRHTLKPIVTLSCLLAVLATLLPAHADTQKQPQEAENKPVMVILPPVIRTQQNAERRDDQVNPAELMSRVLPRMEREADKKNWNLTIVNPPDMEAVYLSVTSTPRDPAKDYKFGHLKALADKLKARYLTSFAINELTGYQTRNTWTPMTKGRVQIDLFVYDRETDEYVWQRTEKAESGRGGVANIGQRMDQAMVNALTRSLDPFAKGERKKLGRPVVNALASVKRTLAGGKKVLLDIGKEHNLTIGDILRSVESDAEIKVTEVLDNGSIAEVVTGAPKADEVFKPKSP
jgi:hypothetical protein